MVVERVFEVKKRSNSAMSHRSVVKLETVPPWQLQLREAIKGFLSQPDIKIDRSHLEDTPDRIVRAWSEDIRGYYVDPAGFLKKKFAMGHYDEMIHVRDVRVVSKCAHHFERIIGRAHFAYIPGEYIVGLSKIPRMIDALSRRLQVQEDLTEQIVDVFQATVQPKGCAVHIRAFHLCMLARGVEEPYSFTETTALRGCFKKSPEARQEFLLSAIKGDTIFP
jgi:GTP cyclohydrolase IA